MLLAEISLTLHAFRHKETPLLQAPSMHVMYVNMQLLKNDSAWVDQRYAWFPRGLSKEIAVVTHNSLLVRSAIHS